MTGESYCDLLGVAFAPEPLQHYINGYAEVQSWWDGVGSGRCEPEGAEAEAWEWPRRNPRRGSDEHRAPVMWYMRQAAQHYMQSGAAMACQHRLLTYLGHMSSTEAPADWRELRDVMQQAGIEPIGHELPRSGRFEEASCKARMGIYANTSAIPKHLAEKLCDDLLEDFVCLSYELPLACQSNVRLGAKFTAMKAVVKGYHGRPAPLFSSAEVPPAETTLRLHG